MLTPGVIRNKVEKKMQKINWQEYNLSQNFNFSMEITNQLKHPQQINLNMKSNNTFIIEKSIKKKRKGLFIK